MRRAGLLALAELVTFNHVPLCALDDHFRPLRRVGPKTKYRPNETISRFDFAFDDSERVSIVCFNGITIPVTVDVWTNACCATCANW